MAQEPVLTVSDLVARLGGLALAAKRFGVSMQTVGNWRIRERIPSRFYFAHVVALAESDLSVSPKLWGFDDAVDKAADATGCRVPFAPVSAQEARR